MDRLLHLVHGALQRLARQDHQVEHVAEDAEDEDDGQPHVVEDEVDGE